MQSVTVILFMLKAIYLACSTTISQDEVYQRFEDFKENFGKFYSSVEEHDKRLGIFHENLKLIEEHNAEYQMGLHTYYKGINQFSDWTCQEKNSFRMDQAVPLPEKGGSIDTSRFASVPDNLDWREKGLVTQVGDQGPGCKSGSWAFAAAGVVEGVMAKTYLLEKISEQQFIDCDPKSSGCQGGNLDTALQYAAVIPMMTSLEYPWHGSQGHCGHNPNIIGAGIGAYNFVKRDELALRNLTWAMGPIGVGINPGPIIDYAGGIFNGDCPQTPVDHFALVVGYGSDNGNDYWIIKNSWGNSWGENGYIKLARNKDFLCGIGTYSIYGIPK